MAAANKTLPTGQDVNDFLANLSDDTQRQDSQKLVELMREASNQPPIMWGTSIIGFGTLHYKYASGREGDTARIGFSPRKGKLVLYLTCDPSKISQELATIGKYTASKSCIYIKNLADVSIPKLSALLRKAYESAGLDASSQL